MALDLMAEGAPPQQAIDAVLAAHPEWDAGLIALHAQDGWAWATARGAARRPGRVPAPGQQGRVALLHNSIYARGMLADELGGLAWARLTGQAGILQWLRLEQALSARRHLRPRDRGRGGRIIGLKRPTRAWPD